MVTIDELEHEFRSGPTEGTLQCESENYRQKRDIRPWTCPVYEGTMESLSSRHVLGPKVRSGGLSIVFVM